MYYHVFATNRFTTNMFYLYTYMNDLGSLIVIICLTKLSVNLTVNNFILMHLAVLIPTYHNLFDQHVQYGVLNKS